MQGFRNPPLLLGGDNATFLAGEGGVVETLKAVWFSEGPRVEAVQRVFLSAMNLALQTT
jgi:hypothetical protein